LDPLIPVLMFLSGSRRGHTMRLRGERASVGSDPACDVPLPGDTEPLPLPYHATLERRGQSYEVVAAPDAEVWVNGERVDRLVLASGDVLEFGRDGAVMRFRLYDEKLYPRKTVPEIFSDCVECVRAERGAMARARTVATLLPRELLTRSTRRFRALTVLALVAMGGMTSLTARKSARIQAQMLQGLERIDGMSTLVNGATNQRVEREDLGEILASLRETDDRVQALEARSTATSRVIREAARSTLFLQGSYGFFEPDSGRPLRMVLTADGRPVGNASGQPMLSLDGPGSPLEIFVTGTGFAVSADGMAITNRHVAFPWEFDEAAQNVIRSGFEARWTRFVGFFADASSGHRIDTVLASDEVDLAVIQLRDVAGLVPFLEPADAPATPGDQVIVLGYPLGLQALIVRTDASFVEGLKRDGVTDFFAQAERISEAGFMRPLATRGIVGQATSAQVAYDAETTHGGSGGPVLSVEGRVIAVNTAILPQFGGSNLGIPARHVRRLMERVRP
jgi:serine protease Do